MVSTLAFKLDTLALQTLHNISLYKISADFRQNLDIFLLQPIMNTTTNTKTIIS